VCRHVGWLGAPRSLADLLLERPHGLLEQSYAPRRQAHGLMNADGWGVGFFTPGRTEPARWRSDRPLWSATSFLSVAPVLESGCVVAAVRSATVGMPADETASAPFTDGTWLVSHNGRVRPDAVPTPPAAESWCDSALLAAHVLAEGVDGLASTVASVAAADPAARLNLLLADGARLMATTWGDTLSVLETDDGTALASEPWDDDPRWRDVPDRHLVRVDSGGVHLEPIAATG
jgi:glutamine amidotransferase